MGEHTMRMDSQDDEVSMDVDHDHIVKGETAENPTEESMDSSVFTCEPIPMAPSESNMPVAPVAPPVMTHNIAPEAICAMPVLQQDGDVFVGPGSQKEAQLIGLGLTKLSSRRKDDLQMAKRYAMDVSIKQIMLRQQKAHQENQQKQAMYAQALSLMARVYIGSISFEVREEMIKKSFEVFGPIKSINMSWDQATGHHKGFAFLEFDVPEAALLAQESMNGQLMGGRNLKVGRPSNMPQAQPIIEMVQQDAKKYHRVYVSSVHPDLSETDVKSVFEAFGEVIKCQLARQSATGKGSHRGFGYIEFNNPSAMNEAISGMNMFDLGGQFLRVGKCITPPEALSYLTPTTQVAIPAAAAVAAAAVTAKVMAAEATGAANKAQSPRQNSPAPAPPPFVQQPSVVQPPPPVALATPAVQFAPSPPSIAVGSPVGMMATHQYPTPPREHQMSPVPPSYGVPSRGFGGFAVEPAAPVAPPPAVIAPPGVVSMPPPGQMTQSKPLSFNDKLGRILDKTKAKQDAKMQAPVTFGALDPLFAPKDPLAAQDEQVENQLAITGRGDIQSMALSIIGDGALIAAKNIKGGGDQAGGADAKNKKRRGGPYEPKKIQPKLNNAHALAAAAKAGELSDAVINDQMNSEDASLASQEGMEIRGNDARHLLMTKLMRTNRSTVLVLRNMVGPEDLDDYLEDEIKEECGKYGTVEEVIIGNDAAAQIVKIFVRFNDAREVDEAKDKLNNRFFAGRTVRAEAYDQAMFDHGDLSG